MLQSSLHLLDENLQMLNTNPRRHAWKPSTHYGFNSRGIPEANHQDYSPHSDPLCVCVCVTAIDVVSLMLRRKRGCNGLRLWVRAELGKVGLGRRQPCCFTASLWAEALSDTWRQSDLDSGNGSKLSPQWEKTGGETLLFLDCVRRRWTTRTYIALDFCYVLD